MVDPTSDSIPPTSAAAALVGQVQAWNRGDLQGYLDRVHPDILYQNGSLVLHGIEALRAHYQGRVSGLLKASIQHEVHVGTTNVIVVGVQLGTWQGVATLTFVHDNDAWWLIGDATSTVTATS